MGSDFSQEVLFNGSISCDSNDSCCDVKGTFTKIHPGSFNSSTTAKNGKETPFKMI